MLKDSTKWYASWFDTPYYHILYKDRNYAEAELFMKTLTHYLNLEPGDEILDLACGKGRHSVYLNSIGYNVTGADLSENSIAHASKFENDTLRFQVHDMCKPFAFQFEAVFNLFTSFGYFENEEDVKKSRVLLSKIPISCTPSRGSPLNGMISLDTNCLIIVMRVRKSTW